MKSLKFVLPCAAVLFAVAPATAASRFACTDLNDAYWLAGMADGSYKAHRVRARLKAEGACFEVRRAVADHRIRDVGHGPGYSSGPTTTTAGFGAVSTTTGPGTPGRGGGAYSCVRSKGSRGCMWAVD
jgi:hypothetical protein